MSNLDVNTISINGIEYVRKDTIKAQELVSHENYVIVRSQQQGVMCGELVSYQGREVQLKNARQIWRYDGGLTCVDVARYGLKKGSRLSTQAAGITVMLEACGIIYCTPEGAKSLQEWEEDKAGRA